NDLQSYVKELSENKINALVLLGRTYQRAGHPAGRATWHAERHVRADMASGSAPVISILGAPETRPGIAGTAYDTAWLAGVPAPSDPHAPRFPTALQWLVEHQWPDGSWGGMVYYAPDRVLGTLAALGSLATYGLRATDRAAVARGTRYLWQHGHLLV